MTFPKLLVKEVPEQYAQENFKRVEGYFLGSPLENCGFKFLELSLPSAVTSTAFKHFLGYVPKDILLLHNLTNATVTFHYELFTTGDIYITSSGATTLRFLIGRHP
jgi:hypothetical protein